jgi:hypothetical protein
VKTKIDSKMDSEYLKAAVGPAMTSAMAALIVEQPDDAVAVSTCHHINYYNERDDRLLTTV